MSPMDNATFTQTWLTCAAVMFFPCCAVVAFRAWRALRSSRKQFQSLIKGKG